MATPSRIKYFGRDWCGHCKQFSKTWESIRALAGDNKTFVSDFKGFSPMGYYPSFTVGGDAKLGEEFGRIMRNYEKPVGLLEILSHNSTTNTRKKLNERIQEAISGTTDVGYKAALEMLQDPQRTKRTKKPVSVTEFIGGSTYGYTYGYNNY